MHQPGIIRDHEARHRQQVDGILEAGASGQVFATTVRLRIDAVAHRRIIHGTEQPHLPALCKPGLRHLGVVGLRPLLGRAELRTRATSLAWS